MGKLLNVVKLRGRCVRRSHQLITTTAYAELNLSVLNYFVYIQARVLLYANSLNEAMMLNYARM
jgi:hypothetical protein